MKDEVRFNRINRIKLKNISDTALVLTHRPNIQPDVARTDTTQLNSCKKVMLSGQPKGILSKYHSFILAGPRHSITPLPTQRIPHSNVSVLSGNPLEIHINSVFSGTTHSTYCIHTPVPPSPRECQRNRNNYCEKKQH